MNALETAIAEGQSYTRIAGLAGQLARKSPGDPLLVATRDYLAQLEIPPDGIGGDDPDAFLDSLHAAIGDEIIGGNGRPVPAELAALDAAICGLRFIGDDGLADAVEIRAALYIRFMADCFTEHMGFARDFVAEHGVKTESSFWGAVLESQSLADQMSADLQDIDLSDDVEIPPWMTAILNGIALSNQE
jgi:hypothetical protein